MNQLMPETITRRSKPNKYDHAPFGTRCKVFINENDYEMYIQRSQDPDDPEWELYTTDDHVINKYDPVLKKLSES